MPLFYLSLTSTKLGNITGSSTLKGREGMIAVYAVQHKLLSPREITAGQITGRAQHRPLTITKKIDRSSPLLAQALLTNESFKEVVLRFYSPSPAAGGAETLTYLITLANASISEISLDTQNAVGDTGRGEAYEQVSFTYGAIKWSWIKDKISSEDVRQLPPL